MTEAVLTPDCPLCGRPPQVAVSPTQAFCGNDECRVFMWNPYRGAEQVVAPDRGEVDLSGLAALAVPTTPSNDPPARDPHTPVPKAEPGPLTEVGPPPRVVEEVELYSIGPDAYGIGTIEEVSRPGPPDPDDAAPPDDEDPEEGHPT